jgi:hypothetical protein
MLAISYTSKYSFHPAMPYPVILPSHPTYIKSIKSTSSSCSYLMIGRPTSFTGAGEGEGEAELLASTTWPWCMAEAPRSSAAKEGLAGGNLLMCQCL